MRTVLRREMARAWVTEFRDDVEALQYVREATDGTFDPVDETYTGGTNAISEDVTGLLRDVERDIKQELNLANNTAKFTILQDSITFTPQENDHVGGYRVVTVMQDPAKVFYNLIMKKL